VCFDDACNSVPTESQGYRITQESGSFALEVDRFRTNSEASVWLEITSYTQVHFEEIEFIDCADVFVTVNPP